MSISAIRTFSVANPGAPICCSGGSTVGCPAGTDVCALVTSTSCGTGRECLDLDKCGGSQDLVPNPYQLSNPPNYYNPGAPATFTCQAQCTDIIRRDITGACVRDGTCRGDALGMCSPGQGCCGVTGGDPYNDGVCRTAPAPTAALRPTTMPQGAPCAWNDETTRGSVVCGGGTYVNTAQYQRPVCALNTLGQPTLLEEQFGTITTILPSGAQPTITTYTIVQQEITYPGVIPLCNGPNAYTLNTISCPSGYTQESTQNIDLGYCADETIGYFDGTEQPITGNSIVCSRTIPVASQGTATPYTATSSPGGCTGADILPTCAPGYSITATTTTFSDPAYCSIMGTIVALPQITSTITCTPTPVVGCGNGVCDWTESGDATAGNYCEEDCTTTTYGASAQCPNNAPAWNAAQGRCETPQCGETGTTGINCATLTAPATTGHYCSQGRNNVLAPQSYCCPQGTFWNPGTNSCQGSAQCYAAPCPYQPPNPLYFTTPACVSTSANAGNPGACCSVGMKDSIIPAYDYSDANGVTVNNFVVY